MTTHKLLNETIDLFVEYRDKHGYDEPTAKIKAVHDVLEGINSEPLDEALQAHAAAVSELPRLNAQLDALNTRCEWEKSDFSISWQTRMVREQYEKLLERCSELETVAGY